MIERILIEKFVVPCCWRESNKERFNFFYAWYSLRENYLLGPTSRIDDRSMNENYEYN